MAWEGHGEGSGRGEGRRGWRRLETRAVGVPWGGLIGPASRTLGEGGGSYTISYYTIFCYFMVYYSTQPFFITHKAILHYTMLYHAILYGAVLYNIPYYAIQFHHIENYTIRFYTTCYYTSIRCNIILYLMSDTAGPTLRFRGILRGPLDIRVRGTKATYGTGPGARDQLQ